MRIAKWLVASSKVYLIGGPCSPVPIVLLAAAFAIALVAADRGEANKSNAEKRLDMAALVLRETLGAPDKHIPVDLLKKAHCVGVFPSVWKGAFFIGGKYGKGYVTCRLEESDWSGPASFRIEGGNIGFQIGGSSTDIVLLFMGEKGVGKLLRTKFTLGIDSAVAAGPVGRAATGKTDTLFGAEIIGYSRSRGIFAGIALDGATMRPHHEAHRHIYGFEPTIKSILRGDVDPPASARPLLDVLGEYPLQKQDTD